MEPGKTKQEREKSEIAPLDFISRLPDSIIHHILTFLPSRDVSCTSILSKTWNRVWSIYPYVVLNFIYVNHDELNFRREKQDFLHLIEKSVRGRLQQEFYMERFQMYIDFPDVELLAPYLDQWIGFALGRTVRELALRIDSLKGSLRSHFTVPQIVLHADSLKVLSLSGCTFENGLDVKLPHLQKLSLSHCCFADNLVFYRVIYGCPVIEYVKVSFCKLMDTLLSVSNLPQMRHFEFLRCGDVEDVKIDVSNLYMFSFASSSILNWPRSIDLTSCVALKELKLNGAGLTAEFVPQPLISQLPALEVLELQKCSGSEGFRISSQRLKRLVFKECRHLSAAAIDTPNLQSFEYCMCDEPFIPINAPNELKVHLIFSLRGNSVDWLTRLKHFLLKLTCNEDLKLIVYHQSKDMIMHEKLSKVSFSSLCNFMYPKSICISSRSFGDLVDELFPVAYPVTLFSIDTCGKPGELLLEKMKDFCTNPNLRHRLVDISVDISQDEVSDMDTATEVFLKAHSIAPYKTSTIKLDWKYDVSRRRVIF